MNPYTEELQYKEKMERISEHLEELMLNAMLVVLDKIIKQNRQLENLSNQAPPEKITF
jgi:hypothetical protein